MHSCTVSTLLVLALDAFVCLFFGTLEIFAYLFSFGNFWSAGKRPE